MFRGKYNLSANISFILSNVGALRRIVYIHILIIFVHNLITRRRPGSIADKINLTIPYRFEMALSCPSLLRFGRAPPRDIGAFQSKSQRDEH